MGEGRWCRFQREGKITKEKTKRPLIVYKAIGISEVRQHSNKKVKYEIESKKGTITKMRM